MGLSGHGCDPLRDRRRAAVIAPHGIDELIAFYGDVKIEKQGGVWKLISPILYEHAWMTLAKDLPGLKRPLFVNKKIERPLRKALENWQVRCPRYPITSIGCFSVRPKRVSKNTFGIVGWKSGLSFHAIAAALDINPAQNPMRNPLTTDMPDVFVQCWTDVGFTHGATFPTADPCHFQYGSGA